MDQGSVNSTSVSALPPCYKLWELFTVGLLAYSLGWKCYPVASRDLLSLPMGWCGNDTPIVLCETCNSGFGLKENKRWECLNFDMFLRFRIWWHSYRHLFSATKIAEVHFLSNCIWNFWHFVVQRPYYFQLKFQILSAHSVHLQLVLCAPLT